MANANSTSEVAGGDPYRRKTIVFYSVLDRALSADTVEVKRIGRDDSDFTLRHDPSHPAADENGYVKTPNVNSLVERHGERDGKRQREREFERERDRHVLLERERHGHLVLVRFSVRVAKRVGERLRGREGECARRQARTMEVGIGLGRGEACDIHCKLWCAPAAAAAAAAAATAASSALPS